MKILKHFVLQDLLFWEQWNSCLLRIRNKPSQRLYFYEYKIVDEYTPSLYTLNTTGQRMEVFLGSQLFLGIKVEARNINPIPGLQQYDSASAVSDRGSGLSTEAEAEELVFRFGRGRAMISDRGRGIVNLAEAEDFSEIFRTMPQLFFCDFPSVFRSTMPQLCPNYAPTMPQLFL